MATVSRGRGEETVGVDDADRWVPPVIGGRGERVPFQDFSRVGRGPLVGLGQMASPGHFSYFLFFSSFSFSIFLFLLYYLQKCFKSIQTTFRNFLKINAII
jgi:hypothetical protein